MRTIPFLLLLLSQLGISQEIKFKTDSIYSDFTSQTITFGKTCEDGTKAAKADFKKGIYNYFTYGWSPQISNADEKVNKKIRHYLKDKYALNYEYKGCILDDESNCYSKTMVKLIEKKFGSGFIDKKLEEARRLYSKNN